MVIQAQTAKLLQRWSVVLSCGVFFLSGALMLWIALPRVLSPLNEVRSGSALVELQPHDAIAFGPAIAFFAFAAMTMLRDRSEDASRNQRRVAAKKVSDRATILLAIAFVGIGLTFVAAPISELAIASLAAAHDYSRCAPTKEWIRHAPMRWARLNTHCPR